MAFGDNEIFKIGEKYNLFSIIIRIPIILSSYIKNTVSSIVSNFHFFDAFSDNSTVTDPRICNPGPGQLTVKNTVGGGSITTNNSRLFMARPTSSQDYNNYRLYYSGITSSCGIFSCAQDVKITAGVGIRLYNRNESNGGATVIRSSASTSLEVSSTFLVVGDQITTNSGYNYGIATCLPYMLYFIKGGSQYPNWTLLQPHKEDSAPLLIQPSFENFNAACDLETFSSENMSTGWQRPYRPMYNYYPTITGNEHFDGINNGHLAFTWRPKTGEIYSFDFRKSDSNNYYKLECNQALSKMDIYRCQTGTNTLVSGASQIWNVNNEYRINTYINNNDIRTYLSAATSSTLTHTAKHVVTGQDFNVNPLATGITITGSQSSSFLEVWPLNYSGTGTVDISPPNQLNDNINENLMIFTTDWHVTDITPSRTTSKIAKNLSYTINSLKPSLVLNLGDNGDVHGSSADFLNYKTYVHDLMDRPYYMIRGNHDETYDNTDTRSGDFSVFDSIVTNYPYHFVADWTGANIRFIGYHSEIIHTPDSLSSFWAVTPSEIDWLSGQIDNVPNGWKGIVCSHPPLLSNFGNNIHTSRGGSSISGILKNNNTKIKAYFHGHRHVNNLTGVQDGIVHVNATCVGYTNTAAGFNIVRFHSGNNTITLDMHSARFLNAKFNDSQGATTNYTGIVISLN